MPLSLVRLFRALAFVSVAALAAVLFLVMSVLNFLFFVFSVSLVSSLGPLSSVGVLSWGKFLKLSLLPFLAHTAPFSISVSPRAHSLPFAAAFRFIRPASYMKIHI
jgi:hypothetical protein